jgi:CBS domain-containing protein
MKVRDIMTSNPACCTSETKLEEVARMMCEHSCGEIPVVDSKMFMKPIGVVTDRDITCRIVGRGKNPLELSAKDAMSQRPVTIQADADVEECVKLLEERQIRRVPVVDVSGRCIGIVAQADIARRVDAHKAGEVVKEVSRAGA